MILRALGCRAKNLTIPLSPFLQAVVIQPLWGLDNEYRIWAKAMVAVAHKLLTIAYTLLRKREAYRERGAAALDERRKDQVLHRLQRRIEQLGYTVQLEPITTMAA